MNKRKNRIIELRVNNHAGVMSHITGLFSRRNFNLEGILCTPLNRPAQSRICLIVRRDSDIEQIIKQLQKLYDIRKVFLLTGNGDGLIRQMARLFKPGKNQAIF